jgi:hypothetical protein
MADIIIQQNRPRIEEMLARYTAQIGDDLPGYIATTSIEL